MVTKDEERAALKKIVTIIAELGVDSYIGAAIDRTVLDIAEDNITNDWLISTTSKIESAQKDAEDFKTAYWADHNALEATKAETVRLQDIISKDKERIGELQATINEIQNQKKSSEDEISELNRQLHHLEGIITELKAKLYDLLFTDSNLQTNNLGKE